MQNGPEIDTTLLILWSASDSLQDSEAAKVASHTFYQYLTRLNRFQDGVSGWRKTAEAIAWLNIHGKRAGAVGVKWSIVFAKLSRKAGVKTVEGFQGIHSLLYWLHRNAGGATPISDYLQSRLIAFVLKNKTKIHQMTRDAEEKKLIQFMYKLSEACGVNNLNWDSIITFLIRKRRLFKIATF